MGEDFLMYDLTSNVKRPVGKRDDGKEREPYWGWAHLDKKIKEDNAR